MTTATENIHQEVYFNSYEDLEVGERFERFCYLLISFRFDTFDISQIMLKSKYSHVMRTIQILDVLDTIDLVSDFETDSELINNLDALNNLNDYDDEFVFDEVKISQKPLRDMTNPIEMFSDQEFKFRYSFSKETVLHILELIVHGLERSSNRGKPVPPLIELLITLKFMTSGTFQSMIDDLHGVSQPTISRLIVKVSTLLSEMRNVFIKYPEDCTLITEISRSFNNSCKFSKVIGCLGSTHVGIKNPGGQISEAYLNEHGYYSLKVQVVCGPNLEFLDFLCRWPGSTHESKIFNISAIKSQLNADNLSQNYLLANSSYPQLKNILTPISSPRTDPEKKYNSALNSTYNVPQAVELWKKRFKCLTTILANKEETTRSIIQATAVLHNIALQHNEKLSDSELLEAVNEPKGKEIKRVYPLDKALNSEPNALEIRSQIIKDLFS